MLNFLRIKDFALIESLEMELGSGFTALTGETGAGKSIILAAVELLMGQRAASDLIRQGAESAVVEALFTMDQGEAIKQRLIREGLDVAEDETELVLRRVVSRQGRNRVQINGQLATVSLLADLGPRLLSVCGQHSHQVLLRPEEHLLLLDAFAGLDQGRVQTARAVKDVRRLDRQIDELKAALAQREQRREYLARTVEELEAADLDPKEEEDLKKERRLLANAEKLAQLGDSAYQGLFAAEEGSVLETLGRVRALLGDLAGLDENASPLAGQVEENYFQLKEAAGELRDYMARMVFDPRRQDWVESRLAEIQRLVRKYGGDVPAALQALARAKEELGSLEQGDRKNGRTGTGAGPGPGIGPGGGPRPEQIPPRGGPQPGRGHGGRTGAFGHVLLPLQGGVLASHRVRPFHPGRAAGRLRSGAVGIHHSPQPRRRFPSPGPHRQRRRAFPAASGPEKSGGPKPGRAHSDIRRGGRGHRRGHGLGHRRQALRSSCTGQVICITHLPQIAAWADDHFSVRKQSKKGRTITVVTPLDEPERVDELARMLGGGEQEATADEHARQMLKAARGKKSNKPGE